MEKQLQKELNELNDKDKEMNILDTGAKYSIFINLNSVDPNKVVGDIFQVFHGFCILLVRINMQIGLKLQISKLYKVFFRTS